MGYLPRQSIQALLGKFNAIKVLWQLFKFDALGQWQLFGVVDGAGGAPHILLPCVRPRLPASTCVLLSSEGTADFCSIGGDVDVDDAAV